MARIKTLKDSTYLLCTQYIYVFYKFLSTDSDYFPIQYWLFVFTTKIMCVYYTVRI